MRKKTLKEKNNIPYELHESDFIDFSIKKNDLIFRVAINCGVADVLGIECEFAEKFYLFDIICHNFSNLETEYNDKADLLLCDIQCFILVDENYLFSINKTFTEQINFKFDCEFVEWLPIKVITATELDEIEATDLCKIV